jgi:hypothetical protein
LPFTLAHAAAVVPVRKAGFVISAFVVGTFGPDFEYFLRLTPRSRFGHTWPGVLLFTLPISLCALWLFHRFIKKPAAALLPVTLERRVAPYLGEFRFGGVGRFGLILLSLLAGICTHITWDLFTHPHTWAMRSWPVLLTGITLPLLGAVPLYKLLQQASTAVGLAALAIWFVGWLRTSRPVIEVETDGLRAPCKVVIFSAMTGVAALGASVRTFRLLGMPANVESMDRFVAILGVTAIAFFSLSLLAYAAWWTWIRRMLD